jgi:hypothetical protein
VNRRGFFAGLAALVASPAAVRFVPLALAAPAVMAPIKLTGIEGWLPTPGIFGIDRAFAPSWADIPAMEPDDFRMDIAAALRRIGEASERDYWS